MSAAQRKRKDRLGQSQYITFLDPQSHRCHAHNNEHISECNRRSRHRVIMCCIYVPHTALFLHMDIFSRKKTKTKWFKRLPLLFFFPAILALYARLDAGRSYQYNVVENKYNYWFRSGIYGARNCLFLGAMWLGHHKVKAGKVSPTPEMFFSLTINELHKISQLCKLILPNCVPCTQKSGKRLHIHQN